MKKIPTLYVRGEDGKISPKDINPSCWWVFEGLGRPTRKYDGTACLLGKDGIWWSRRMVREGATPPRDFQPIYRTFTTPYKTFGWILMEDSQFRKMHKEALHSAAITTLRPGTYELIGPKINGNPEGLSEHRLQSHDLAETIGLPGPWRNMTYEFLQDFFLTELAPKNIEGIVWHGPDSQMAKLKVSDFVE